MSDNWNVIVLLHLLIHINVKWCILRLEDLIDCPFKIKFVLNNKLYQVLNFDEEN